MNQFYLDIEASSSYGAAAPALEILVDGTVVESAIISSSGSFSFLLDYPSIDTFPSALSFRFNDGFGEGGRTITIADVRVNGQLVDPSNISQSVLNQNDSGNLDTSAEDHLFGRVTPTPSDLGTATISGTAGSDDIHATNGDDVIDAGGGNDRIRGVYGDDAIDGGHGNDTIYGEDGNDIILGGDGDDLIFGNNGDDLIFGEANNDRLIGGNGNDALNGGTGNDALIGGNGADILYGEDGNDRLTGQNGDDIIYGDAGADTLVGGNDNDTLYGGTGDDYIIGGNGNDTANGDDNDDFILGNNGADTLNGDAGDDYIYGGNDNDVLNGGADSDALYGDAGNDTLNGDAGADTLVGGMGADTLNGGTGNDILHGHGLDAKAISAILNANPNVSYSEYTNSFYQYVDSSVNYATASASAAGSILNGVAGHLATITSQAENDFLSNLIPNQVWIAAADTTKVGTWSWTEGLESGVQFSDIGGASFNGMFEGWIPGQPQINSEFNTVLYTNGDWHDWEDVSSHRYVVEWDAGIMGDDSQIDTLSGDTGNDILYGYGGDDILNGGDDEDLLFGGTDNDTLNGGNGSDFLYGQNGADTLNGGGDNDNLYGDAGNDALNGDNGNDTLSGGIGDDTLNGGTGNDTIFGDNSATNTIMEAGTAAVTQTNSTQWHSVTFSEDISSAVVKMFGEDVSGDPFTIRVRDITSTGFEFQLDEYDFQDGSTALENISWIAVTSGSHTLSNGIKIDAGFVTASNETASSVSFNNTINNAVVFSQISSDNELSAVATRNNSVTSSGFSVTMQEEEANANSHATEDIGWIAIESGGSANGGFLASTTGDNVTDATTTINFGGTFASTPIFIADMQTLDGGDTATAAGVSLSTTQAQVFIDEESSSDAETAHTTENIGYLALNTGTYAEKSLLSDSDTIYGDDGDDILYADTEADGSIAVTSSGNPLETIILNNAPDAYWNLSETSGTTADNLGSLDASVDGTINGTPTMGVAPLYAAGNSAIDFDGINDGILIPDSIGINTSTYAERTVELVFNADDVTTRQVLFEEGATVNGLTIYLDGGNIYVTGEDDGDWVDANINAPVSTGTTYHIAFVFDQPNNSFTGYLDGVDIGSVTVNNTIFPGHSGDIGIGYAPDGVQFHDGEDGTGGYHFDGRISDVALYNTALTQTQIQERSDIVQGIYPAADPIDDILYGGDGFDQLYGGDGGRDVFVFETTSAFNDVDEINAFDISEQDAIDISDLLTGYTPGTDAITDWLEITNNGSNSDVKVDTTGTANFSAGTQIASIIGVTGLTDETQLLINNNIIT